MVSTADESPTLTLPLTSNPSPPAPPPSLRHLETFLVALGLPAAAAASPRRVVASAVVFVAVAAALPATAAVAALAWPGGGVSEAYQIPRFELCVLATQLAAAAVAFGCVARGLAKHGVRGFLFVDEERGLGELFQAEYQTKIKEFYFLFLWWIVPCFLVKTAREVFRFLYILEVSKWKAIVALLASIVSWTYLNTIILASCGLFNLACNLQIVHFDDFGKLLEQDLDPGVYVQAHLKLRKGLSKISHRFRMFLLLLFLCAAATQFVSLLETTGYNGSINFINAEDLVVSCIVQTVAVVICLQGAAKISRRAQGIASLASKWHALVTCSSSESTLTIVKNSSPDLESQENTLQIDCSESDLESLDVDMVDSRTPQASNMSTFHKREALVMYLQSNHGGLTVYGWTVDRTLLNTIFFVEMTLVLFVLGKTIVLSH